MTIVLIKIFRFITLYWATLWLGASFHDVYDKKQEILFVGFSAHRVYNFESREIALEVLS